MERIAGITAGKCVQVLTWAAAAAFVCAYTATGRAQDSRVETARLRPELIAAVSDLSPMQVVLRKMTQAAGVIFAGTVVAVGRPGEAAQEQIRPGGYSGIVEVTFQVDQALRGVVSGSHYTIKEWAGLWNGPGPRYRAGQHLLVFLRAPNKEGLSSPVHGFEGLVPLHGGGRAPGPYDDMAESSEWMADLRWVQAQALRSTTRSQPIRRPIRWPVRPPYRPVFPEEFSTIDVASREVVADKVSVLPATSASTTNASEPLTQVLRDCRSWIEQADEAR